MRMVRHRGTPGVEHGGDADARTKMTLVGGDGEHGLRRCPEQQVVHDRLVVESDVGEFGGNAENDVEVSDWQQVGLALGEPRARGGALALGAVPVATANGKFPLAVLWANSVMGSQRAAPSRLVLLMHHFALHYRGIPEQGDQLVRRPE